MRCTCPRDPDDEDDPGDALSTCPVHGWSLDYHDPMALWFELRINAQGIGLVQIQRREPLDLGDPSAIRDAVSTYTVMHDHVYVGTIRHRYGDGAMRLVALATALIADASEGRTR